MLVVTVLALALSGATWVCGRGQAAASPTGSPAADRASTSQRMTLARTNRHTSPRRRPATRNSVLPSPSALRPFTGAVAAGQGIWSPSGRPVDGHPAVYETSLVPPGAAAPAGIAWMDTRLLSARLCSGSLSPGGGPYTYTAPVQPAQAASLVAAFNGGFQMKDAGGGYYTEGQMVYPLRTGAASLVIYNDGSVNIGAWGSDVSMTPKVVAVRQNLVPLVADGKPTPLADSADWQAWGNTCGATSYASTVPGIETQWRSGVGITATGALVYVTGPALDPLQLAQLLARAGVVRGMELDINPNWTVLVTYDPSTSGGLAAPANGSKLVTSTVQGPSTFFEPSWNRDFVTMSARPAVLAGLVDFRLLATRESAGHRRIAAGPQHGR